MGPSFIPSMILDRSRPGCEEESFGSTTALWRRLQGRAITNFFRPTRIFYFLLQTKHLSHPTLGSRFRDAWVALAWPLGHPSVTQSQTQSPAEGRRQRVAAS